MTQHPITPPPELVQQWWEKADQHVDRDDPKTYFDYIATQAAQWGADQELEACCALMDDWGLDETDLRFARRPKPPSLKEQALKALTAIEGDFNTVGDRADTIRQALEALPND